MATRFSSALSGDAKRSWRGSAFIVEALILLVFLAASLAILFRLFAVAYLEGQGSVEETKAIHLASNTAEVFAANPERVGSLFIEDGLLICCDVTEEQTETGTLYHADITVRNPVNIPEGTNLAEERTWSEVTAENPRLVSIVNAAPLVYQLQTARYVREGL